MLRKVITGFVAGSVLLGAASAAWSAAPPSQQPPAGKVMAVQPDEGGDVPPPAQPAPKKKESFLPLFGLGALFAIGTGVAIASDDNNPASP